MAATIGVTELHGIAVPEGGYAHESSSESSRKTVATKDNLGVTVFLDKMAHAEEQISVKGVGDVDFSIVAASNVASGAVQILSATATHELGKRAEFEITARKLVNDV